MIQERRRKFAIERKEKNDEKFRKVQLRRAELEKGNINQTIFKIDNFESD